MTVGQWRTRTGLPAAMAAILVGGAVLAAAPAQAAEGPTLPEAKSVERNSASDAELLARVEKSIQAMGKQDQGTAGSATPQPSGTADSKIIGGTAATITEAPWMVQLHYRGSATEEPFFCGGTLVSPSKVVTAAHCVAGANWKDNGVVVGGSAQLPTADPNGGEPDLHGGKAVGVWRQWKSPTYTGAVTSKGDIAVLTLAEPLPYKTLQLTSSTDTASYQPGTARGAIYGWGRTSGEPGSPISPTLQKATVPVASDAACTSNFGSGYAAGHMVCVGDAATGQDAGTVTACNGDSGGPLVVNGRIAGVVSYGVSDCIEEGAHSVFTKSSAYVGQVNPRVDDANLNADDRADLVARASTNAVFQYYSTGSSLGGGRDQISSDWSGLNLIRQADLNGDDYQDYVLRTLSGELWWTHFDTTAGTWADSKIGTGWGSYRNITITGDVTGDGFADVTANDSSGTLWMWSGRGNGTVNAKVKIGVGWATYAVYGKGDYSGDGKPDLLARDAQARLWVYKGTGNRISPFSSRVQVGSGWNFTAYATTGDFTGDGRADFMVRDSSGYMWAYKGTGSATTPFITSQRIKVGTGWKSYNLFG